ncbi:hydrogenase/urease accessory protein [Burkholderiales bacterium JOSHI_001]|nr:hydrogenase/urease accessory protein [Burkholderiales bacterium JOSHI_001]
MRPALLCLFFLVGLASAQAHVTSTGLATLDARGERLAYRLTLNTAEVGEGATDLQRVAAGDAAAAQRLASGLPQWLHMAVDGQACRIARTRVQTAQAGEERLVLQVEFACASAPGTLAITDSLWQPLGEHYRSIVSITAPDGTHSEHVFSKDRPQAELRLGAAAPSGTWDFFRTGLAHIATGLDHLLFLAALLVGSRSVKQLLLTVTAFTLAHSVALALAVMGWVNLSPKVVEPLIAASIVWVAAENLWLARVLPWRRAVLAFGFGLVHGLAFSEVLTELHLSGWALGRALLGFNLGVEAGQAAVVLLLAPVLAWLARQAQARRWERAASAAIGAAGLVWLVQRLA